jgi:uncharacterized protein YceK
MKILLRNLIIAAGMLVCLSSCGTLRTVSAASIESPKIYSGTRIDYYAIVGDTEHLEEKFNVRPPAYPFLDLPFSFALDTVVLPLTYPVSLYEAVFH